MKSIEHYEQLAREAKAEGDRHERRQCGKCGSFDIFDRELALDANWQITTPPAAVRFVVSVICYTCKHNLSLGPSNDEGDGIDNEIVLAEWLADNACLFEPGAKRDEMDEFSITTAFYTSAVEPSAVEPYTGECFEDGEP